MGNETKQPKVRVNGIKTGEWVNGRLHYEFIDGTSLVVDPGRMSVKIRELMLQHGIEARVGDKGAVEIKDFPDAKVRAAEARRRMAALTEHLHSGTDDWEMRVVRSSGPDIGLLIRALIALGLCADVDSANALFQAIAGKREIERDAAVKLLWEAEDVAKKVRELREEGKTYAHKASDLLKGLIG